MSETKKTTDFWGREKEEHFDDAGNKVGETRFTTDWKGDRVQLHFDTQGNKTGETRAGHDWLGRDRAEHTNAQRESVGTSRNETDWLGRPVQRHYDSSGAKVGETRTTSDWLGRSYKEHKGEYHKAHPTPAVDGNGSSSYSYEHSEPASSGVGDAARTSNWPLWAVLAIVALVTLAWFTHTSTPAPDEGSVAMGQVPAQIRAKLEAQFPGWSFPEILPVDQRECPQQSPDFFPGLVWGDFDGDGLRDYGVAIQHNNQLLTIAFLARGNGYREFVLQPSGWKRLDVLRKGSKVPVVIDKPSPHLGATTLTNDALIGVGCQTSAAAYTFSNGSFLHFFMSD